MIYRLLFTLNKNNLFKYPSKCPTFKENVKKLERAGIIRYNPHDLKWYFNKGKK